MALIAFIIGVLAGISGILVIQLFTTRNPEQPLERDSGETDDRSRRLEKQWDDFLSYNGSTKNGGY